MNRFYLLKLLTVIQTFLLTSLCSTTFSIAHARDPDLHIQWQLIQTSDVDTLLENSHNLHRNKWDWALPVELLRLNYASTFLDFEEAIDWINEKVTS